MEEETSYNSQIVAFMKDNRQLTFKECLELYLSESIRREENHYLEQISHLDYTVSNLKEQVRRTRP